MNISFDVNKSFLRTILIAAMSRSPVILHFPYCSKLKTFTKLKTFLKKIYSHLTQKCDYSPRLFVPVAESITLEFKRLTYEALTSAVSQGAGTKPRIARLVVQIGNGEDR